MVNIGNDWDEILRDEFKKEYYIKLREFLKDEYKTKTVYPEMHDIYNALSYTPFKEVKVVILGQDPYHGPNQAHGLAFSVKKGVKIPPSLANIYKELNADMGIPIPEHGCLTKWAMEGVLLLNAVLTVRAGEANSHKNKGWERLTDTIIAKLNEKEERVVFILWGANARKKKELITNPNHRIIESVHPSPLSCHNGFFGGKYFSRANKYLAEPIDWNIK